MPRSPAADVTRLLDDLASSDVLRRETAIARLAIAGAPAVTRLVAVASDETADAATRAAALRALSASSDPRAIAAAAAALSHASDDLVLDAIDVLAQIAGGDSKGAARAFDHLSGLALDAGADVARRLAALTALEGLPDTWLRPLYRALATDPASPVMARVTRRMAGALVPIGEIVDRGWPDDPALALAVLRDEGAAASLSVLRRAIDACRAREREAGPDAQAQWIAVRGQVHQVLAARGSTLGLFDLRDTMATARAPLPVGFLAAAAGVGDASCLEPIARAWIDASPDERWWRDHLHDAFRAIVLRKGLTRRHVTLKKILERWPAAAPLVALAKK